MKIKICGIPYDIVYCDEADFDESVFGEVDSKKSTIRIDKNMTKELKEATLVHEWIHAVFHCNEVKHSEIQVGVLATELYRQGFRVKGEK